jgi:hypothetical protein
MTRVVIQGGGHRGMRERRCWVLIVAAFGGGRGDVRWRDAALVVGRAGIWWRPIVAVVAIRGNASWSVSVGVGKPGCPKSTDCGPPAPCAILKRRNLAGVPMMAMREQGQHATRRGHQQ